MEYPASSRPRISEKPSEWTNKIKAIQRQVDTDEESEQKRLEDEIAASRLARRRRSRGVGSVGPNNSLDLSESPELARVLDRGTSSIDNPTSIEDRQKSQGDALRKLTSSNATSPHLSTPRIRERLSMTSPPLNQTPPPPPVQKKPEPVSLAAFMGGRATGPRLNRHAPQQDAHDPTQFEQRTRITAPHPVFGKGGVAMPGMTASAVDREGPQILTRSPPIRAEWERDRTWSNPSVTRHHMETVEPVVAPQMTGRERRMSTPGGVTSLKTTLYTQETSTRPELFRRPVSALSTPEAPKTLSPKPQALTKAPSAASSSPAIVSRYTPPYQQPVSSASTPQTRKSSVYTPSLARSIIPEARPSPQAPQIPPSQNLSPAFLRPPAQRDPTPSISRLQGRGFVQNMVKVSSALESTNNSYSASNDKGQPNGRRSAVLDRWHPAASASSSSLSPPVSPKPIPLRKSRTVDSSLNVESSPVTSKTPKYFSSSQSSLMSTSSLPAISDPTAPNGRKPFKRMSVPESMPPEGAPGLGSSSTLISYIKPTKTGDDPLPLPAPVPPLDVDELGIRSSIGGVAHERTAHKPHPVSELPAPSRTPLSHPTKDRARKPRKTRESSYNAHEMELQSSGYLPVNPSTPRSPAPAQAHAPRIEHRRAKTPPDHVFLEPRDQPPRQPPSFPDNDRPSNVGRVSDRWADQNIIGIKPLIPGKGPTHDEPRSVLAKPPSHGMVGRRALPGMAQPQTVYRSPEQKESNGPIASRIPPGLVNRTPPLAAQENNSSSETNGTTNRRSLPGITTTPVAIPPSVAKEEHSPSTPTRHGRIPSTGNRATVMDVAQALQNQRDQPVTQREDYSASRVASVESSTPIDIATLSVAPRRNTSSPQAEKRKSSYEKYSAITLPPLQEEKTPLPSPAGTLSRNGGPTHRGQTATDISSMGRHHVALPGGLSSLATAERGGADTDVVHFDHVDEPLPNIDIDSILEPNAHHSFTPDLDLQTISVDLMAIVGNTASAISRDTNVFYDTEVLAVIYRTKSKSSGLASTAVWAWRGKRSQTGEREERKLQELAKRYGAILENVPQHSEPPELVHLLGGHLAIRQGTRAHWTSENTAMHLVRSYRGVIFIDEHDLDVKNLCSGFSYCLSILDTLYVWYGRGSTPQERLAALEYAQSLASKGLSVVELAEGEDDSDEMFWMILGDEEYAKADYWKWRQTASVPDPRIWRINASDGVPAHPVSSFLHEVALQASVYVIDCVWEYFVLVGRHARGKRQDIRLAVSLAMRLSDRIAASRPYAPTIHVLIIPTQLPLDFRLHFRDVNEASLNDADVPNHMNIISCKDALGHLRSKVWEKAALKDHSMLPLGLDSSDIP